MSISFNLNPLDISTHSGNVSPTTIGKKTNIQTNVDSTATEIILKPTIQAEFSPIKETHTAAQLANPNHSELLQTAKKSMGIASKCITEAQNLSRSVISTATSRASSSSNIQTANETLKKHYNSAFENLTSAFESIGKALNLNDEQKTPLIQDFTSINEALTSTSENTLNGISEKIKTLFLKLNKTLAQASGQVASNQTDPPSPTNLHSSISSANNISRNNSTTSPPLSPTTLSPPSSPLATSAIKQSKNNQSDSVKAYHNLLDFLKEVIDEGSEGVGENRLIDHADPKTCHLTKKVLSQFIKAPTSTTLQTLKTFMESNRDSLSYNAAAIFDKVIGKTNLFLEKLKSKGMDPFNLNIELFMVSQNATNGNFKNQLNNFLKEIPKKDLAKALLVLRDNATTIEQRNELDTFTERYLKTRADEQASNANSSTNEKSSPPAPKTTPSQNLKTPDLHPPTQSALQRNSETSFDVYVEMFQISSERDVGVSISNAIEKFQDLPNPTTFKKLNEKTNEFYLKFDKIEKKSILELKTLTLLKNLKDKLLSINVTQQFLSNIADTDEGVRKKLEKYIESTALDAQPAQLNLLKKKSEDYDSKIEHSKPKDGIQPLTRLNNYIDEKLTKLKGNK